MSAWKDIEGKDLGSFPSNRTPLHPLIDEGSKQEVKKASFTMPSKEGSGEGFPPQQEGTEKINKGECVAPPYNLVRSCTEEKGVGTSTTNQVTLVEQYADLIKGDKLGRESDYLDKLLRADKADFLKMLCGMVNEEWINDAPVSFPKGSASKLGYAIACCAGIRRTGDHWEQLVSDMHDSVVRWNQVSLDRLIGFIEGWAYGVGMREHLYDLKKSAKLAKECKAGLYRLPWSEQLEGGPLAQFVRDGLIMSEQSFRSAITTYELYFFYRAWAKRNNIAEMTEKGFQRAFSREIRDSALSTVSVKPSNNIARSTLSGKLDKAKRGWLGFSLFIKAADVQVMNQLGFTGTIKLDWENRGKKEHYLEYECPDEY